MKKCAVLLLALCLTAMFFVVPARASAKTYFAFGDSIATGYGVSGDVTAYPTILANRFGYALTNLAVNGATSTSMLARLRAMSSSQKASLKTATLVTVSIGGNDIIGDANLKTLLTEIGLYMMLGKNYSLTNEMRAIYETLESNLVTFFTELHALAPDATIVFQSLYNPYLVGVTTSLATTLDYFVQLVNYRYARALNTLAANGISILYVDIAAAMNRNPSYFYVGSTEMPSSIPSYFDFHPTAAGHVEIAELIAEAYSAELQAHTTTASTTAWETTSQTIATEATVYTSFVETTAQTTALWTPEQTRLTERAWTTPAESIPVQTGIVQTGAVQTTATESVPVYTSIIITRPEQTSAIETPAAQTTAETTAASTAIPSAVTSSEAFGSERETITPARTDIPVSTPKASTPSESASTPAETNDSQSVAESGADGTGATRKEKTDRVLGFVALGGVVVIAALLIAQMIIKKKR